MPASAITSVVRLGFGSNLSAMDAAVNSRPAGGSSSRMASRRGFHWIGSGMGQEYPPENPMSNLDPSKVDGYASPNA